MDLQGVIGEGKDEAVVQTADLSLICTSQGIHSPCEAALIYVLETLMLVRHPKLQRRVWLHSPSKSLSKQSPKRGVHMHLEDRHF